MSAPILGLSVASYIYDLELGENLAFEMCKSGKMEYIVGITGYITYDLSWTLGVGRFYSLHCESCSRGSHVILAGLMAWNR